MTKMLIPLLHPSPIGILEFGYWKLFGVWNLVIGI